MAADGESTKRTRRSRLLRFAWGALGLWCLAGVAGGFLYRGKFAASWTAPKLAVPVVAIESDDWGLDFEAPVFVPPSDQLDARQAAGVERLSRTLAPHRDSVGRKPVVSAFVVVRQADTPAIAADPNHAYHSRPIDRTMPRTVAALRQAEAKRDFFLTYHARDHRDAGVWASKVKAAAEKAQAAGEPLAPAVVSTFVSDDPNDRDRVFGEYFDNVAGYLAPADQKALDEKVRQGVSDFERIFGRRPGSTVPPRYLWGPGAEGAFQANGIRYLHGINRQGGRNRNPTDVEARVVGMRLGDNLIGLTRTLEFERDVTTGRLPEIDDMLASAERALANGQPIVICTHTWNYCTGDDAVNDAMARRLDELLSALEDRYPHLRYVHSEELGRLAETGRLGLAGFRAPEIRVAGGLKHAWFSGRHIYCHRTKAKLYAQGFAVLLLFALGATVVHLARRPRRARDGPPEASEA